MVGCGVFLCIYYRGVVLVYRSSCFVVVEFAFFLLCCFVCFVFCFVFCVEQQEKEEERTKKITAISNFKKNLTLHNSCCCKF